MRTDYICIDVELIKIMNELNISNGKAIMLYAKILSLAQNEELACTAGNEYFARIFCTTDRNVRNWLKELEEAGFIKRFEYKKNMRTTTRYLYPQLIKRGEVYQWKKDSAVGENTGKKLLNQRKIFTESQDGFYDTTGKSHPPIIEYNRQEENRTEEVAYAPDVATLQAATPEYILNLKFNGNIPNDDVLISMRNFCHHRFIEGIDIDEFREDFMEAYTSKSEFIKCDTEPVEIVLDWFLEYSGVKAC